MPPPAPPRARHANVRAATVVVFNLMRAGRPFERTSEAIAAARCKLEADELLEQLESEAAHQREAERP
ncbi:hypothetical protein [Glycomyces sp. L485]|uniref:hypothetical protein n=1 Tax=Glycomyces sp. L485 TaxID=2909235 RepID=UPI001F4B825E|nr:hypothetical protein [Glycomyces sp. L485]